MVTNQFNKEQLEWIKAAFEDCDCERCTEINSIANAMLFAVIIENDMLTTKCTCDNNDDRLCRRHSYSDTIRDD